MAKYAVQIQDQEVNVNIDGFLGLFSFYTFAFSFFQSKCFLNSL